MQGHHNYQQQRTQQHNLQFQGNNPGVTLTSGNGNNNNMHSSNHIFTQFRGDSSMESRGATRVVYNSGDRGIRYGSESEVRDCDFGYENIVGGNGNYQFHSYGPPQGKPFRQQQNNSFRGESYMQRNYIRPHGTQTQARFVSRIQGCKMKPQTAYRNFVQQQKQKPPRGRFNQPIKHFSTYQPQPQRQFELNPDTIQVQNDVQDFIAQQRDNQQSDGLLGNKTPDHSDVHDIRLNPARISTTTSPNPNIIMAAVQNGRGSSPSLKSKIQLSQNSNPSAGSSRSLSYEDISENSNVSNSDDNNEVVAADLRERLLWKKHCEEVVKREPGEIYSDEEDEPEPPPPVVEHRAIKRERESVTLGEASVKTKRAKCSDSSFLKPYPQPITSGTSSSSSTNVKHSENSKSKTKSKSNKEIKKEERRISIENNEDKKPSKYITGRPQGLMQQQQQQRSPYNTQYSFHDSRYEEKQTTSIGKTMSPDPVRRKECCIRSKNYDSTDATTNKFCCPEAEINDSREKLESMKKVLRDTRDKLLEARVVGSKKATRLQEEVDQLKAQLLDAVKTENEMKQTLKAVESELATKRLDLSEITKLHDIEIREKEKFRVDLTRTYQDRLTIEIDKLRALFDIELAKMQAFYLSQNLCYEDGSPLAFVKGVSDCDLRNHNQQHFDPKMGLGNRVPIPHQIQGVFRPEAEMNAATMNAPSTAFIQRFFDFPGNTSQCGSSAPVSGLFPDPGIFKCPSNSFSYKRKCNATQIQNPLHNHNTSSIESCASAGVVDMNGYGHIKHALKPASSSPPLNPNEPNL